MSKKNKSRIILIAIALLIACVFLFVPSINSEVKRAIKILSTDGVDGIINYIRGYGVYAAVISFLLMILQSIISPIPAFFITLANAAIFGWALGALLSWTSSMVGAVMCFYIARILGRDVVEKMSGSGALKKTDDFFKKYGKNSIIIARLLPFISFDLVSYAAGLTSIGTIHFIVATGLGQLPATLIYSYVGGELTGGAKKMMFALLILFAVSIVIFTWRKIYTAKQEKEVSENEVK